MFRIKAKGEIVVRDRDHKLEIVDREGRIRWEEGGDGKKGELIVRSVIDGLKLLDRDGLSELRSRRVEAMVKAVKTRKKRKVGEGKRSPRKPSLRGVDKKLRKKILERLEGLSPEMMKVMRGEKL